MTKHYVGETGTQLILDTGILIGSATVQHMKWQSPSATTGTFTASLYDSYSELAKLSGTYLLSHTLAASDFTIPGIWKLHAFVASVSGTWLGEMTELNIFDSFQ